MSSSRLLLVEKDPARAERIFSPLQADGFVPFPARSLAEAKEALVVQQFDVILISTTGDAESVLAALADQAKRLSPRPLVLVYGEGEKGPADGVIPSSVSEASLGREIKRLTGSAATDHEAIAAQLSMFDLLAFRQQMGDDPDLMTEVIKIFFDESADQLKSLNDAISNSQFAQASRVAHSLKGSLGSLHAERARHWAQALEAAAVSADADRCRQCLCALQSSISALEPRLQELLPQ